MSPTAIGIVGMVLMIIVFFSKMPVAYVMALTGFLGFCSVVSLNAGLNLLPRALYETFSSYSLTTVPLFILMGQLAFSSGISSRLYDTAYKFLGDKRGGLAIATISACTAFGTVCGSSAATAATMATVGLPEMRRFKYSDALSAGCVAAGGGLGMIMPPSVVLLIYGILTENSIGELFCAGIIPAIIVTGLFALTVYWQCRGNETLGPVGESFSWKERVISLSRLLDTVFVFALCMGGLFIGLFTPTEAAAVGVFGVLFVAVIQRQLTWNAFVEALYDTLKTSCMVMMLVAGAAVFGKFLAVTRIPFNIATWVGALDLPPYIILSIILCVYFVGGCFMDSLAMVMLTIPIFYPVIQHLGYDPIWFGVMIVMITEMGVISPPVGINVYVVFGVARGLPGSSITMGDIFKGILPFMLATLVGVILFTVFPWFITVLPDLLY